MQTNEFRTTSTSTIVLMTSRLVPSYLWLSSTFAWLGPIDLIVLRVQSVATSESFKVSEFMAQMHCQYTISSLVDAMVKSTSSLSGDSLVACFVCRPYDCQPLTACCSESHVFFPFKPLRTGRRYR